MEDFGSIKLMSKYKLSKIVKQAYLDKAFEDLLLVQSNYTNGNNLIYGKLSMRNYFKYKKSSKITI